jgi:anti-sigma factor RsiW
MREELQFPKPPEDELMFKALLYASGELDPEESAAFEERLGEDQAVRDALCRAVELTQTFVGNPHPGPDPAYRARVRHRLRNRRRQRLFGNQGFWTGNPAIWSVLGATAAVFLIVLISHFIAAGYFGDPEKAEPKQTPAPAVANTGERPITAEMADFWAELHSTSQHLEKAQLDEKQRKLRADERERLARGDDTRNRLLPRN